MWSPCFHSTNWNGPVPTGLRSEPLASIERLFTISPLFARFVRNGPNGVDRWNVTRVGEFTSMRLIAVYSGA